MNNQPSRMDRPPQKMRPLLGDEGAAIVVRGDPKQPNTVVVITSTWDESSLTTTVGALLALIAEGARILPELQGSELRAPRSVRTNGGLTIHPINGHLSLGQANGGSVDLDLAELRELIENGGAYLKRAAVSTEYIRPGGPSSDEDNSN